jgi:hypothetical protein
VSDILLSTANVSMALAMAFPARRSMMLTEVFLAVTKLANVLRANPAKSLWVTWLAERAHQAADDILGFLELGLSRLSPQDQLLGTQVLDETLQGRRAATGRGTVGAPPRPPRPPERSWRVGPPYLLLSKMNVCETHFGIQQE